MKIFKIIILLSIIFLLSGCTQNEIKQQEKLSQEQAITKLKEAGCFYDLSKNSECIVFEEPDYIIQAYGCFGKCSINAYTQEITLDSDPMCTGSLIPDECTRDADCSSKPKTCASSYSCTQGSCIPVFS